MRRVLLALGVVVAACGTPQEQCIRLEARELFVLDRLIAGLRADIERGYAIDTVTRQELRWIRCSNGPNTQPRMCHEWVTVETNQPRAIDPVAEQRKLAGLMQKRREVETTLAPQIAACKARYPA